MPLTLGRSRSDLSGRILALALILLSFAIPLITAPFILAARAVPLTDPVRITFNTVEDRTSSGSLMEICNSYFATWLQEQSGAGWRIMWAEGDI